MPSGFSNQAKILRGAFVEFGISLPPLIVVFQFNPLTITRTRTAAVDQQETPGRNRVSNGEFINAVNHGLTSLSVGSPATSHHFVQRDISAVRGEAEDRYTLRCPAVV